MSALPLGHQGLKEISAKGSASVNIWNVHNKIILRWCLTLQENLDRKLDYFFQQLFCLVSGTVVKKGQ